jgi:hypothetical protein
MNSGNNLKCRVCGLLQSEPPWGEDGMSPTFFYCPCCGVEFGYGDATLKAIKNWRANWISTGYKWSDTKSKPENWNVKDQIKDIPE